MIEKLSEYKITKRDGAYINADNNVRAMNTLVVKVNELVDAVNSIVSVQERDRCRQRVCTDCLQRYSPYC